MTKDNQYRGKVPDEIEIVCTDIGSDKRLFISTHNNELHFTR